MTLEARCYGFARRYDPFIVNTVVGFIGPEYLEIHGLGTPYETAAWYGDAALALGRRGDWPARALRSELAALANRLATLIPAA